MRGACRIFFAGLAAFLAMLADLHFGASEGLLAASAWCDRMAGRTA